MRFGARILGRVDEQRYEPLPSLIELPAWGWRRLSRRARVGLAATLLAVVAITVVLVPAMRADQRAHEAAALRERAAQHAQAIRDLRAEQRPHFARSHAATRAGVLGDLRAAIVSDARARSLPGPILRAACEPFPKTLRPAPARPTGNFACVAITAEIDRTASSAAGVLGHPYRARVDFTSGRFAFCKISGRPDPIPDPAVTTPKACGGT